MTDPKLFETDIAIIGAGPVGLFAIFECGMLNMACHVIDTLPFIGGQCKALYPEKPIYDIPAYPEIMAGELVKKLETQSAPFEPTYHLGQTVDRLERTEDERWHLTTSKGTDITAKVVMIAGGSGTFGPNKPPLENLEKYEESCVFYMVRRREDFRDKRIVIAGGGDSAVDWALSLAELAKKIYVVHRRERFRAQPDSVSKMFALTETDDQKVELVIPYLLDRLEGDGKNLEAVQVKTLDGQTRSLEADILLPFYGLKMALGPIKEWELDLEKSKISIEPATCQTNREGIFAIGDIASYPGKKKLILQGFSEAAMAAYGAYPLVHPDKPLDFQHSTDSGVPGKK